MSYVAYFDEAGISNPHQEPFLVVAAVIVNADKKLVALKRHLDKLVERHIPAEHQPDFVFHAKELFNGGGRVLDRKLWPLGRRLEIAAELADVPRRFDLPIAYGFAERATFPQTVQPTAPLTPHEKTLLAHVACFMSCALQVEHWMRRKAPDDLCFAIVEDNDRARQLIRDTQVHHQDPRLREQLGKGALKHFPFKKIMEDPSFQPKRPSSILQLADFCAYVFKRFPLMNDERYRPLIAPIWPYLAAGVMKDLSASAQKSA